MNNAHAEDVLVTCNCGVETPVANRWMVDAVTCRGCGSRLHMTPHNTRSRSETQHSAILQHARHGDQSQHSKMAARFVQEGKFCEAELLYKEMLQQKPQHRDALYGIGFIAYKRGQLDAALGFLRQSVALGHPHAARLVQRIAERTGTPGAGMLASK